MTKLFTTVNALAALVAFAPAEAGSGAKPAAKPAPAKEAPAKEAEAKDDAPKEPKRGIGTAAREALMASATNEEALAAVRKEFPDANTTKASINWYRNDLRKKNAVCVDGAFKGKVVPSARDMNAKAKAEKEAAEAAAKPADKGSDPTA